ncbi:MAG TPA: DNA repair protein RecN, partial [Desulfotomaculum sp.]|nr:DNA repair protein RecN [Desulfotomaculum sp.]
LSPGGQDTVEFLISPNPGEPLRPLARIASGGELSRVMLAIRTILATTDRIPSLVFDEIDTGIGGKTLHAVAEKLAHIAKYTQVICVTHAAQVACRAGTHFYVFKEADDDHTVIRVELLRDEQRLAELARMLAGKVDGLAREHARQMLEQYNHGL